MRLTLKIKRPSGDADEWGGWETTLEKAAEWLVGQGIEWVGFSAKAKALTANGFVGDNPIAAYVTEESGEERELTYGEAMELFRLVRERSKR